MKSDEGTMIAKQAKPRRRTLTKAQRRQRDALTRQATNSSEHERELITNLTWMIAAHPGELPDVIEGIDREWFTVPELQTVAEALHAAVECDDVRPATVLEAIKRLDAANGLQPDGSIARRAFIDAAEAGVVIAHPAEWIRNSIEKAAEKVRAAYEQRQRVREAFDTFVASGIAITTPIATAPTKIEIPGRRGVPLIRIEDDKRAEITDQAEEIIAGEYFNRGGRLARVADGIAGQTIEVATQEAIADTLERAAGFYFLNRDEYGNVSTHSTGCPSWLPQRLAGKQRWPAIRELRAIAYGPFLRPDGSVGGTAPGYDAATKTLVMTDRDWSAVNETPSADDVHRARETLLDVVRDFPFEADHAAVGQSVWLAALLTVIGRPAFGGPSPLFVFDATTPGSGKTLLARLVSIIARGCEPSLAGMPESKAELQKSMTAALQRGDDLHIFDNVTGTIGNSVLDQLLTSWTWQDRRLGTNETIEAENRMTLIATANNARIGADTARRSLTLRLQPLVDNPEARVFDRNVAAYAREHRPQLVAAAITMLRWGFIESKEHPIPVRPMGSFEGWSDVVRVAVIRAGLPDPLESQQLVRRMDDGGQLRDALLEAWEEWNPRFAGTARKLVCDLFQTEDGDGHRGGRQYVDDCDAADRMRGIILELTSCARNAAGSEEARKLGFILRAMKGRIYQGRCVDTDHRSKGGTEWRLLSANQQTSAAGRPATPK